MAYQRIYDRFATEWTFVADGDDDVTDIEANEPDAPVGSIVLVGESSAAYIKFPAGSFIKWE